MEVGKELFEPSSHLCHDRNSCKLHMSRPIPPPLMGTCTFSTNLQAFEKCPIADGENREQTKSLASTDGWNKELVWNDTTSGCGMVYWKII